MTVIEQQYMSSVPSFLKDIARQLKIANELKAMELRNKYPEEISVVDDIIDKS